MPDRLALRSSMRPHTPKPTLRALQIASVVACLFAAAASGEEPKSAPPPTAPAAKDAATPTTVPPSKAPAAPPAGQSGATGAPTAAGPAAANDDCDRYVGALQGRGDRSLLDKAEVQELAISANDLIMCRAVLSDSDAACSQMIRENRGPGMACRQTMYVFRELRKHPDTHAFMFTESDVEECHKVSWSDAKVCDTLREALLANDASKCATLGERQTMCRAYVELDPALCQLPPEAEQQFREALKKAGPEAYEKNKNDPPLTEKCKQAIDSKKFLAQGLKKLAESGPPRERALARAALGQADACGEFAKTALETCRKRAPGTPVAPAAEPEVIPPGRKPPPKPDAAPPAEKPKA